MTLTLLGDSFSGSVKSYPIEKLEKMFSEEDLRFSDTGRSSMLRSLAIPEKFFLKQSPEVRKDLLIRQKTDYENNNLLFLVRNDEVVYSTVSKEENYENILWQDPKLILGVSSENDFVFRSECLSSGYIRFVYQPKNLVVNSFVPTLYIDVPILYHGQIKFEIGLYRVICTNGMIDNVTSTKFALKNKLINSAIAQPLIKGIVNGLVDATHAYDEFIRWLENSSFGSVNWKNIIQPEFRKEKVLPRDLNKKVNTWINYIAEGEGSKDDDSLIPETIDTKMDLVNAVTRYSQSLPTLSAQKKVESKVFDYFYHQYKKETNSSISGLDLKYLAEATGVIEPEI